jgi:hypothetical protein
VTDIDPAAPLVTLHIWGVPTAAIAAAVTAMARDRAPLRKTPGLEFAKLLGTGSGRTFTVRDSDPHHWAILCCWSNAEAAANFNDSDVVRRWDSRSDERARITMRPLTSRGSWSGKTPFGTPTPRRWDGAVAAITRARIKTRHWPTFWRAVPPVSADLRQREGLQVAMGIGEAPVGLQGTFSIWRDSNALRDFAHRGQAHQRVMERTTQVGWYAEELFARLAVLSADGDYRRNPIATL